MNIIQPRVQVAASGVDGCRYQVAITCTTSTTNKTITQLCDAHVNDPDGASPGNYQRRLARAICHTLNIIQPGHCSALN